ncbi:biotin-dependent carboxyltransferase family protein [Aquisalibacillus elongatus]|uniref:Biotin-dependent carboxylase-like uncharacterized protein n=1 Tax=Aquisalibacillus elongatus TaxID=485577 RepID=A0A3N5BY97_9BACI|nr:biotin-dependent carboxyltransferase family protein [Aquisalibacillus elongatus]RPF52142.1 biotin-dependent carboxylase-like uncharacterized protein [Aquisalibacillus elongatus]
MLEVLSPGVYTSIQDQGRLTYRSYGVPISGAMDSYAFEWANALVGNNQHEAAIEVMYGGAKFKILEDVTVSITGAPMTPKVDCEFVSMWTPIQLNKGQQLSLKGTNSGVITYIALAGGVDSPEYLGSQSVYEKAGLGRRLKKKDRLSIKSNHVLQSLNIPHREIPTYTNEVTLRVVPSHHESLFDELSIKAFYSTSFTVTKGDRMGALLKGDQAIELRKPVDIISEAVTFGTIQVPPSGDPVVLLADSQTTGGYPTIGSIMTEDLWRMTQIPPNGKVRFKRWNLR